MLNVVMELSKYVDAGFSVSMSKRHNTYTISVFFFKEMAKLTKFVGEASTLDGAWLHCKREIVRGLDQKWIPK